MKINDLIKEHSLSSSFLVYSKLFKTENYLYKFIWFFLLILSFGSSAFFIKKVTVEYMNYEVITNINVITDMDIEFPTVTFYFLKNQTAKISIENIGCQYLFSLCSQNETKMKEDKYGYVYYQFKTNKPVYPGSNYGLLIYIKNILGNSDSFLNGIKVLVHDDNRNPQYYGGSTLNGVGVTPGFYTNLQTRKVISEKLGEPYNNCIKNVNSLDSSHSDIYKFILTETNYTYTQEDCFNYCAGRELLKFFNITPKIEHVKIVATKLLLNNSFMSLENDLKIFFYKNAKNICLELCPLECDTVSYEVTSSTSRIFETNSLIQNNISIEDIILFELYFSNVQYTKISQTAKREYFDLISNIGGIIGAFMGISFLFICELFELILMILFNLKNDSKIYFKKNQTVQQNKNKNIFFTKNKIFVNH